LSGGDAALPAIARAAIAEALGGSAGAEPPAADHDELRGVFVTLRRRDDGDLRGCVGMIEPRFPLMEAVRHAAVAAAFEDPRFPPVRRDELPGLAIHVSVLTPLAPASAADVVIGRHGVVIRARGRSALLLPEVAVEQDWDRETLLRQLCRKAGLPPDAWQKPDSQLYVFETVGYSD
jgi:AmmeMemoRadiSam system protein A